MKDDVRPGGVVHRSTFRVLLLAVLLAGCGGEPKPAPKLVMPDWHDGEVSEYVIVRHDSTLFRRRVSLAFDEEGGIPLVVVTNAIVPESAAIFFSDSTVAALRRFSLKPAWSYRAVATDISASEVFARYEPGRVTVRKETVEGEEERSLSLPPECYGAEMLSVALRGLPLEPGAAYRAAVAIPLEFRVEPVEIVVLGTKRVTTRVGDVLCREVEVTQLRRHVRLAYELAEPHRLVAMRDIENETETVLAEYVPATTDTLGPVE